MPELYLNIDELSCKIESLGELRKYSQLMNGWAKVSEGGLRLKPKVTVSQIELSLT